MRTIRSVLTGLARSPVKSFVTLSTVGLGVGVLIFALSISGAFSRLVSDQLERGGLVVMVANVERDEDGALQQVRPPQFDGNAIDALRTAHRLGHRRAMIQMPDDLADNAENPGVVQEHPIKT